MPLFQLYEVGPGLEPRLFAHTAREFFKDGKQAAAHCQCWAPSTCEGYTKIQPRKVDDSAAAEHEADMLWHERERKRLYDGTYRPVPWHYEQQRYYEPGKAALFAHVDPENPELVRFTPDALAGRDDRKQSMRPGRYLRRYHPEWCKERRDEFANQFVYENCPVTLRFAHSADEIEHVYRHGPASCMSHSARSYSSPFHPVRVYGAGDLAVAYIYRGENKDSITARAVCWPEKKVYSRIYGDETRLESALHDAGYREGYFIGARLTRHEHNGYLVCPYIDWHSGVSDNGEHLIIEEEGELSCESTSGLIEQEEMATCDHCETRFPEHRVTNETIYGSFVCDDCAGDYYTVCEGDGRLITVDDTVTLADGRIWSERWFRRHGHVCEECSEARDNDDPCTCHEDAEAETVIVEPEPVSAAPQSTAWQG